MPAQTAAESSVIASFLMDLPHPDADIVASVHAAAAWFKKTAIYGHALKFGPDGRHLVDESGAGPLWARYYEIGTDRPLFGDRDKSIHDNMDEISAEPPPWLLMVQRDAEANARAVRGLAEGSSGAEAVAVWL